MADRDAMIRVTRGAAFFADCPLMMTDNPSFPQPHSNAAAAKASATADTLKSFLAVIFLFAAGVALGGLAGRLSHPFAAIALLLPLVGLSAYLYRPRVASVVAIGGMAAWALTREITTAEPAWSLLFTFTMSLLILFGTGWLMESLVHARHVAWHYAHTEPLTGLLHRNAFLSRLQWEIDRSRRLSHPLAVAFLDCDNFKAWNDSRGHLAGDDVLKLIARTLREETRSYDVVARMGGDEFAVLFPELAPETASNAARRLHDALRNACGDRGWPVTVSLGLVALETFPDSARDVVSTADRFMYEAKRRGKNQVVTHSGAQPMQDGPAPSTAADGGVVTHATTIERPS